MQFNWHHHQNIQLLKNSLHFEWHTTESIVSGYNEAKCTQRLTIDRNSHANSFILEYLMAKQRADSLNFWWIIRINFTIMHRTRLKCVIILKWLVREMSESKLQFVCLFVLIPGNAFCTAMTICRETITNMIFAKCQTNVLIFLCSFTFSVHFICNYALEHGKILYLGLLEISVWRHDTRT